MTRAGDPGAILVTNGAAAIAWAALATFVLYGSLNSFGREGATDQPLSGISLPDIAQNLLLYVPFGIFGVWALRRKTNSQLRLCVVVTAIAAVYSSAMELLQLASASRIASVLDVFANTIGAGVGALSSAAVDRGLKRVADVVRPTGLLTAPARYALVAILTAIAAVAWYPFDVTLDVSTLSARTRAVRLDPWLPTATQELWAQGGRFFVLTAILAACLPGLAKYAAPVAAVTATAAALLIDVGQLAMGRHPVGGAVLAAQALGAGAAAIAIFVWRRNTPGHALGGRP